jgi:hypothetical protein
MYVSLFEEKNPKLLRFAVVLTTLIPFQGPERLANAINEKLLRRLKSPARHDSSCILIASVGG